MTAQVIHGVEGLRSLVGVDLPPSPWVAMSQERIDRFAACTEDPQWIHLDRERAAQSPFQTTIAHGFLTLSMVVHLWMSTVDVQDIRLIINYGLNRVRFPAPVPSGSRIRGHFRLESLDDIPGGVHATIHVSMELEGGEKPVCVAEMIFRYYM